MVLVIKKYKRRNGVIQLGSGPGQSRILPSDDTNTRHFSQYNVNRYQTQNDNLTSAQKNYRRDMITIKLNISHKRELIKKFKRDKEYVDELNEDISALLEELRLKQDQEKRIFGQSKR
jgi:uncharacterized membrane protein